MSIKSFKNIIVWQKSHKLALSIYRISSLFPAQEQFNLTSQIRRCAVSIPSNIAEGFARKSLNDSKRFYIIAEGSLEELRYQLLLANDLGYIKNDQFNDLDQKAEEVGKLLGSWKRSQKF